MQSFHLVETTTSDKLIHQGLFYKPEKSGNRALLLVPGLTSTFYANIALLNTIADTCFKAGLGFAVFNNRGHDMVTGIRKIDRRKRKEYTSIVGGAGYENFKDCVFDIEAGVHFLVKQGFTEVVVIGHSTGANKVCYFAGTKNHPRVQGVVLVSPLSDRLGIGLDTYKLEQDRQHMQDLVNQGKGDELILGYHFFPLTPKRFLSIFEPNSTEDTFDYGDPRPRLTYFSRIKKPLLVIIGGKDEHLDRSAKQVLSVFDSHQKSTKYSSVILPNALHSFNAQEKELTKTIVKWIKML